MFGYCRHCGEALPLRVLIRRLFAVDPEAAAAPIARPPGLASPGARIAAALVDVSLMIVVLFWVGAIGHDAAFGRGGPQLLVRVLAWVAVMGHVVLLEGASGQSFGKRLVGIRVVDHETGAPIGYGWAAHRCAARALFWFVSFLALGDPRLQTLHDRSAGTVVVNDRVADPRRSAPSGDGEARHP